jgi:hypothetical protein
MDEEVVVTPGINAGFTGSLLFFRNYFLKNKNVYN